MQSFGGPFFGYRGDDILNNVGGGGGGVRNRG